LNNSGVIAGYIGINSNGPPFTYTGFVRDPSGSFAGLYCPSWNLSPTAINDNLVVVGSSSDGAFIATPVPGSPRIQFSVGSIVFPPMFGERPSDPVSYTVTNTGDGRLDLGDPHLVGFLPPFAPPAFQVTACMVDGASVASLNPGESCTAGVAAWPRNSPPGVYNDTLFFRDSSGGSPHSFPVSVSIFPAPMMCLLNNVVTVPPRQASFTMRDGSSGLASIVATASFNVSVNIPMFSPGTISPVAVVATQVDPTQPSSVAFAVTNQLGGSASCSASLPGSSHWTALGGTFTGRVAAITDRDGVDEAFVRGTDNALWHTARTGPGGSWSEWESFGGVLANDPVVVDSGFGLQVYVLGSDNSLWRISQTSSGSSWSGRSWEGFEGVLKGEPAVVFNADNQAVVLARGADDALWTLTLGETGGSGWSSLAGVLTSNPSAAFDSAGELHVFVLGSDSSLWHISQDGPTGAWLSWEGLNGFSIGDPVAVQNVSGGIEVFVRGGDSALWHTSQNGVGGAWSGFTSLGGLIRTNPAAAVNQDGSLDVFAVGSDTALWHISQTTPGGAWSTWTAFPGSLADQPEVFLNLYQFLIEVFARGADNALYHIEQSSPGVWN
jgi:hypothetical protein